MANLTTKQLGVRLRRLRETANLTPYDVERTKICKRRTLNRIERGESVPDWPIVDHLARLYKVDVELRTELNRMAREASERGWWEPLGVPKWFGLFMELEQVASAVRVYETEYVTGLLQTEDTMRAILAANSRLRPEELDRYVKARLVRQREFFARRPVPTLELAIGEGVIRRAIGGPDVHAAQLERLREVTVSPGVSVYVVPFEVGAPPGTGHPFTLLEFPDDLDRSVVYSESALAGRYDDTPDEYSARSAIFAGIRAVSIQLGDFL